MTLFTENKKPKAYTERLSIYGLSTMTCASWISTLDDEVMNQTMENCTIVVALET